MKKVKIHLKEILIDRDMTQKQLSSLSGLRESTISEIARNSKISVNLEHLAKIADALSISDIAALMSLEEIE